MNKFSLIVFIFIFSVVSVFADVYTIYSGEAEVYRDIGGYYTDQNIVIRYDDTSKNYYLCVEDIVDHAWILLSEADLEKIRYAFAKYEDWVQIAKEHNVEIDKEIPDSSIETEVIWELWEDEWYDASGLRLTLKAISLNSMQHFLVISSNKVTSSLKSYVTFKLDTLYFNEANAEALLFGIREEKIESVKEAYNKKKAAQDLFQ